MFLTPHFPTVCSEKPAIPQYSYDDYVSAQKGRLQTAYNVAKKNLIDSKVRSKDYYDKGTEVTKIEVEDKFRFTVRPCGGVDLEN